MDFKVVFEHNAHGHVVKMLFGAGARRYVALLALVCNFDLPRMFITCSNEVQAFKVR